MEGKTSYPKEMMPPQSLEAERSLLGAVLLDQEALPRVLDRLKAEDFYDDRHREIFAACESLYEKRRPIDLVTLTEELKSRENFEEIGGVTYLTTLANSVPSSAHLVHYAETVAAKATLRRLIAAASRIGELGYKAQADDLEEALDEAEQTLFAVSQRHLKTPFISVKDVLSAAFERLDKLHSQKGELRGAPTGFSDIDNLLAGLQKSDLIVVASRPAMGKSSFVLNIAQYAAVKKKYSVGIFSLEMSKDQLIDRMIAAEAGVDSWKLRTGNLNEEDFARINEAFAELSEAPFYIDDSASVNVMEIRTKARRLQAEKGLDLVIVDYLQLMEGRKATESRVQEISEISRALKGLARELDVPVVAVSQLSRAVEQRPRKIPLLSDLRESGSIEQDADVVLFIYRDDYYNKDSEKPNVADIIIAKHRNGPTGQIELYFDASRMQFRSLERRREPFEPASEVAEIEEVS